MSYFTVLQYYGIGVTQKLKYELTKKKQELN